jgi:hypothetical protein
MKRPSYHTRSVLEKIIPKYCKGYVLDAGAGRAKYKQLIQKHSTRWRSFDHSIFLVSFNRTTSSEALLFPAGQ